MKINSVKLKDKQIIMPQPKKIENLTPPASLVPKTSVASIEKSGDGPTSV